MIKSLYHTAASKALAAVTTGLLLTFIAACSDDEKDALSIDTNTYYDEAYRPSVHFTPKTYWTNDPNGIVLFEMANITCSISTTRWGVFGEI